MKDYCCKLVSVRVVIKNAGSCCTKSQKRSLPPDPTPILLINGKM